MICIPYFVAIYFSVAFVGLVLFGKWLWEQLEKTNLTENQDNP